MSKRRAIQKGTTTMHTHHITNFAGLAFVLGAVFLIGFIAVIEYRAVYATLQRAAREQRRRREQYEPLDLDHWRGESHEAGEPRR
jgi:hypothetical protein